MVKHRLLLGLAAALSGCYDHPRQGVLDLLGDDASPADSGCPGDGIADGGVPCSPVDPDDPEDVGVSPECDWRATSRPYSAPTADGGVGWAALAILPGRGEGEHKWALWGHRAERDGQPPAIVRFGLDPSSRLALDTTAVCDVPSEASWTLCPDGPDRIVGLTPMKWGGEGRLSVFEGYTADGPDRGLEDGQSMTLLPPGPGGDRPTVYYNHVAAGEPLDCLPDDASEHRQLYAKALLGDGCESRRLALEGGTVGGGLRSLMEPSVARRGSDLCIVGLSDGQLLAFASARGDEIGAFVDVEVEHSPTDNCYRPTLYDLGERWLLSCAKGEEPNTRWRIAFFTSTDCRDWRPVETPGAEEVLDLGDEYSVTASVIVPGPGSGAVVVWPSPGRMNLMQFDDDAQPIAHDTHSADDVQHRTGAPSVGKRGDEYLVAWPSSELGRSFSFLRWTCARE